MAFRMPTRLELARSLRRLGNAGWPLQGAADHKVSEAIYLSDPDGIDIEIYRDYPRSDWPYRNGSLQMGTEPLDFEGLMQELETRSDALADLHSEVDRATVMGHVHLKVSDIAAAERFYVVDLGFDLIQRYGPSAAFVSAGGYHHHIGFNTWQSAAAPPPPAEAIGLRYLEVDLPGDDILLPVVQRLQTRGWSPVRQERGWLAHDPSGNTVLLTSRGNPSPAEN